MRALQRGRATWRVLAAAFLAVAILPAFSARGQNFTPIPRDLFEQQCDQLTLEGSARDAAEDAYAAYRDALQLLREHHDLMGAWLANMPQEQSSGRPPKHLDERDKPLALLTDESFNHRSTAARTLIDAIEHDYFRDLQSISGAPDETITELQRDWKRANELPRSGGNYGGNVDLMRLVHETLPDQFRAEPVQVILDDWADSIDQLLARYEASREKQGVPFRELFEEAKAGAGSFEDAARALIEPALVQNKFRTLNARTVNLLRGEVTPDDAELLRQVWIDAKWPFVWYRGREDRRITAALDRDSLTDDQREALLRLQAEIHLLRERTTRRLDTLHRAMHDADYVVGFWAAHLMWREQEDRTGPRPEQVREDAFEDACAQFVEDIETLGERIDQILSHSGGGS